MDEPFLHLIGDHVYVSSGEAGCSRQLVEVAEARSCSMSGVQATRDAFSNAAKRLIKVDSPCA